MVGLEFGIQFYVIDVAVICEGDIQKSTVCFVLSSRGEAKEKKNEERRHDVGAEKHLICFLVLICCLPDCDCIVFLIVGNY